MGSFPLFLVFAVTVDGSFFGKYLDARDNKQELRNERVVDFLRKINQLGAIKGINCPSCLRKRLSRETPLKQRNSSVPHNYIRTESKLLF